MTPAQFAAKLYNHLLLLLFYVCLINSSCHAGSGVNNNHIQCVETERVALLQFKQSIHVDSCGLLDSWGHTHDCCQWRGIHCNNHSGHVISLHLPGIQGSDYYNYKDCLEGTLSVSLLELKHLKYLDLSFNHFQGQFPKFIGSLSNLEHLNLSHAGFTGVIPQEIGNLSRLISLDLSCDDFNVRVESLWWLSQLRLLKEVDLGGINMSVVTNTWLPIVNSLPFLQVLRLDGCQLSLNFSSSLSFVNSSSALNVVSLLGNNLNDTPTFEGLFNLSGLETSLIYLDLSSNQMFANNIQVSGRAMKFLGNLCSLQHLDLSDTNLNYNFSDIVQSFSMCPHKALMSLDLNFNQVWGSIPDNIDALSSLRKLYVGYNQLNGTISQALGRLFRLEFLDLSSNSLKGVVSNAYLSNLSKLILLSLGDNTELVVNISANWIPPFQLNTLYLSSCKVGPHFPMWLLTQKNLTSISLDNASISDTVPVSFFNSLSPKLEFLTMSDNMMYGELPNVSITFEVPPEIHLNSNNFHGAIPPFLRNVSELYLNNNNFSQGLTSFLCPQNKMPLTYLDLSNNLFSDKLPDCWGYFDNLLILHLENNKLWGNLPTSIGALDKLSVLHLSNNNISGELPSSLANCTSLVILDLAHNSLTGNIPAIFGHSLKNLAILNLQSNDFVGALPSSFCHLSGIQILDLSNNHVSGPIPRCIYNLKGMANTKNLFDTISFDDVLPYNFEYTNENTMIMWKRKELIFEGWNSLGQAKTFDISNNMLEGHIPEGISSLIGLVSINLSRNHLSGLIPSRIGQLASLETLDLSHNHLSGEIPTSLAKISSLDVLDLSYNNLSGEIPTGTQLQSFDDSSYVENPGLCGAPLPKCDGAQATTIPQNIHHSVHDTNDFTLGLYISVVLGFIIGFWGVCGTLVLKTSWRHAFFQFYDDMKDRIYVNMARVWRRS